MMSNVNLRLDNIEFKHESILPAVHVGNI